MSRRLLAVALALAMVLMPGLAYARRGGGGHHGGHHGGRGGAGHHGGHAGHKGGGHASWFLVR